jgi:hypothetical protein
MLQKLWAVSKLGFWFPAKSAGSATSVAAVRFHPEEYCVFRGLKLNAQRRDWAKKQFRNSP